MTFRTFLRNSAATAVVAALAITALPAQAAVGEDGGWRTRGERSEARHQQRTEQPAPARAEGSSRSYRPAPAPQAAAPQAAAPQVAQRGDGGRGNRGGWRGNDGGNRGGGGDRQGSWQRGGERQGGGDRQGGWQRPAPAQPQAQPPVQQQQRQQWGGTSRNGAYAGDRNRTYRSEGQRDGNRDWRRDGDRDWQRDGRRDGDRREEWQRDRRQDWRQDQRQDWRENRQIYRDGYRSGQRDYRQWDRRWRDDRRYDWNSWRQRNRTTFNIGIYSSPYRNYSYRRLNIGFFLDSLFYTNRYWISDPWQYRLPAVYGPYRWVRYYDDVLLVDTYSGEVVDVIYDFFW